MTTRREGSRDRTSCLCRPACRRWFLVLVSASALAHHSAAMFEEKKTITVEGVVKEFQFTNPHSWLLVDVKDKNGKVTTWGFEAEGPSTLAARRHQAERVPGRDEADHHRAANEGRPARRDLGIGGQGRRQEVQPARRVRGALSGTTNAPRIHVDRGSRPRRIRCHRSRERLAAVPWSHPQRHVCGTAAR